jgi:hypothetical protein
LLKGRKSKGWNAGVNGETQAGYQIYKNNGRYYSRPSKNPNNEEFLEKE